MTERQCLQCGRKRKCCKDCGRCKDHCNCGTAHFDADELGLDPETDNNPEDPTRHA